MKYPPVTVAMLIYRSEAWMNFALEGLIYARNKTPMRVMVVGNDANDEVMQTGRVDVDFRNTDPNEYYLNRVYKAWNASVAAADTDFVCMINSDMYVSDYWLDELVEARLADSKTLPCGLLVESGRIPSAMPEYVRDFGTTVDSFDREAWRKHAAELHARGKGIIEPGRLFMPVLVDKHEFAAMGGYPPGNIVVGGGGAVGLGIKPENHVISGDRWLFDKYMAAGFRWATCLGSVTFHTQEGEMRG